MNKTEFLESLRIQLSRQMQESKVAEHVNYYRNYIDEQIRNGRSEADVLAELGEARLIAKTLMDTDTESASEVVYDDGDIYYEDNGNRQSYTEGSDYGRVKNHSYKLDLTTWYGKIIAILIAVAVIAGLIFLIGTVLPILILVFAVLYVISRFRKK